MNGSSRRTPAPRSPRLSAAPRRYLLPLVLAATALTAGCNLLGGQTEQTSEPPAPSASPTFEAPASQEPTPQEPGPTASASTSPTGGSSQGPTGTPTSYPAPQDAMQVQEFRDLEGRSTCSFQGGTDNPVGAPAIVCQGSWSLPAGTTDIRGRSCEGDVSIYLVATDSQSGLFCFAGDLGAPQDKLAAGDSVARGDFACTASSTGTTCWSTTSGFSFAFSREGWMTGTSGAIPQSEYTW